MQEGIRRYGDEVREREGIHVLARVGLNSGEVVVGSVSNDLHVEYSAIGATTHLAARMEQLAVPGTVQVTAETLRLVEGLVEVKPLGKIPVKGVDAPGRCVRGGWCRARPTPIPGRRHPRAHPLRRTPDRARSAPAGARPGCPGQRNRGPVRRAGRWQVTLVLRVRALLSHGGLDDPRKWLGRTAEPPRTCQSPTC